MGKETEMRNIINGEDFREMIMNAAASISNHKQEINELNVFPVPDGDTGSNMSQTVNTAAEVLLSEKNLPLETAADKTAAAMLRGARGNSGVILSLLFRGIAGKLKGIEECDGRQWAEALTEGVRCAYDAVEKPAEGTILTVARLCAEEAKKISADDTCFEYVLDCSLQAAADALKDTVNQNPVLKKAGVIDAGGKGWVVAVEAMLGTLRGHSIHTDQTDEMTSSLREHADFSDFDTEEIEHTYCTEFIVIRHGEKDPAQLRRFLSELGDSLVLISDEEIIKVHVHTDEPCTVLNEAVSYGDFDTVKVENMKRQHTQKLLDQNEMMSVVSETQEAELKEYGIVCVCSGDGLEEVFLSLGADEIVSGGQTMNPSTENILRAVEEVPAKTIFVLPNNKNIIMAARQVDALTEKRVLVVPTKSIPQGVSAMLEFDPDAASEENLSAMTEVIPTVDTMQLTYAARDSRLDGKEIHKGEYLALYNDELIATGTDIDELIILLSQKAVTNGKRFITIYSGADISEDEASKALNIFSSAVEPLDGETNVIDGGQPLYYYIISAE